MDEGGPKLVSVLLKHGADPNVYGGSLKYLGFTANMLTAGGEYGTALHAAVNRGNLELVKLLLEGGADVNAQGTRFEVPCVGTQHVE
jgi:ankyrin repeat protein